MKHSKTQSLIHPLAERTLRQVILKDLENKGRKGYDKPHTEAVVFWMKKLLIQIQPSELDSQVLITAAYAHDWGYSRVQGISDTRDFDKMIKFKPLHMQFSAEMIEVLLYSRLGRLYTEKQKLRTIHLVSVHDKVRELTAEDELLLMEADTLGGLDRSFSQSTLSKADEKKYLETSIYNLRLPRFVHDIAKDAAKTLLTTHYGQ